MTPARGRRSGITLDPDSVRVASGGPADPPVAEKKPTRKPAAAKPAPPEPEAVPEINPDALEGEAFPGEERIKIGTVLPVALKQQMDGFVRFCQISDNPPEDASGMPITTFVDTVRVATHRFLQQMQDELNDGKPFPVPRINKRGRPAGR